ncbi:MAG: ribonuclease HIII [Kiritimatiellae bacterium]|nr:ribonuclease HIII [Kiritimatiellia bacterium]
MEPKNLFTYTLTPEQASALELVTQGMSTLERVQVPYTSLALKGRHLTINLYTSGKLVVQGKEAQDFVLFTLEPLVLGAATLGYEEVLDPKLFAPHMGTDESGKGDIFGPLITVAVFIDETTGRQLADLGIRDSKTIADSKIKTLAAEARKILGRQNCAFVLLRPPTYNRVYDKIANLNRLLAWCHARAIETLAEQRPDCPRAVIDQFARTESTINRALMPKGRKLIIEQMHKAERDIAVAAASVLARDIFVKELAALSESVGIPLPKGAGPKVPETLVALIKSKGPSCLPSVAKCHFKTIDDALARAGFSRNDLPEQTEA